jgi:adenine-specific DNA methylase
MSDIPYYLQRPSEAPSSSGSSNLGLWTSLAGAALQAVGTYYAVKSQKAQLESQALSLEHQASMSAINARAAESDAQAILEAAQTEAGQVSAQYGQAEGETRAAAGGRGIEAGPGSQAEVQASIAYAKKVDIYQIQSNAVRAANAARTGAVNATNESNLARVSAANVRKTAGTIDPYLAAGSRLLSSASGISDQWLARNRTRYRGSY